MSKPWLVGKGYAELERTITELEAQQQWQPMKLAPKDGTEILGWRKNCGTLLVRWGCAIDFMTEREIEISGLNEDELESEDWFCADFISGSRLEGSEIPTLWTLISEPAALEQEAGE
jgi:hypothetical protein